MARGLSLALVVVLVVLTGCASMPWQKKTSPKPVAELEPVDSKAPYTTPDVPQAGLPLSSEQRFKDVPLPTGLKEDAERTFVYESASLQIGRMVYTTRASVVDLANFYIKECPATGWKMQDVLEATSGKTVLFTKLGKRLVVNVQNLGMAVGRRLTVTLTPEAESSSM